MFFSTVTLSFLADDLGSRPSMEKPTFWIQDAQPNSATKRVYAIGLWHTFLGGSYEIFVGEHSGF